MEFRPESPSLEASADAVAVCRALLAKDADALQAIFSSAEPIPLAIAACWLVIFTHRAAIGGGDREVDAALADLQRQWLDIQARHPASGT